MNIYIITNIINSKQYVGITTRTITERFRGHKYTAGKNTGYYLHNAMRKYGFNNFVIKLLDTTDSIDELKEKEIFYIKKYDTYKHGYNLTKGGDFSSNKGYVIALDKNNNILRIPITEFVERSDLVSINKNKITVFKNDERIRVTTDEYRNKYFNEGWRSKNYGFTVVKDKNGNCVRIKSSDFDKNIHKGVSYGTQIYFNPLTQTFESLKPHEVDKFIYFNKLKLKYIVYDSNDEIINISMSKAIDPEFGGNQFRYLINRNKDFNTLVLTEKVFLKLKPKNRNYDFLGYKLEKLKYK